MKEWFKCAGIRAIKTIAQTDVYKRQIREVLNLTIHTTKRHV